jgi:hypothetical protein
LLDLFFDWSLWLSFSYIGVHSFSSETKQIKVKSVIILLIRDINVHKKKITRAARGNVGHNILIFGLQVSFKKRKENCFNRFGY